MEQKLEPKRALICILIALLGGVLSIILVLIRHYAFSEKN
jgi:LPS O-antigen subunit length determinant protein (WzzB/FepE family)